MNSVTSAPNGAPPLPRSRAASPRSYIAKRVVSRAWCVTDLSQHRPAGRTKYSGSRPGHLEDVAAVLGNSPAIVRKHCARWGRGLRLAYFLEQVHGGDGWRKRMQNRRTCR